MNLYDDHDEYHVDEDNEEIGEDIIQEDAYHQRGREGELTRVLKFLKAQASDP
ncbi:hypothetical protein AXF42_Ash011786 [Apostasia shenzhenica]|uniref:Uncharacterized protein n=1 Tax=Apostasia shenzhenica TaxID=1088818 RepID=A0A2H9ZUZ3_9ASPA|nr:hypothetical protein AXF42_Ash011786 [Apostasia shenzhenica]